MSTSADDLLDQAVSGNRDALATLLEQYGPRIRQGLTCQIPPRWQAVLSADDVMQQSYVDAFMDISGFDPRGEGSFIKWLRTLTKRNLLDAIRMLEAEKRGKRRRNIRPALQREITGGAVRTARMHPQHTQPPCRAQRSLCFAPARDRTATIHLPTRGGDVRYRGSAGRECGGRHETQPRSDFHASLARPPPAAWTDGHRLVVSE